MLEVEGQDREPVPLGEGHYAAVDEADVQIGEASVDLDRASEQRRGEECHGVFAGGYGSKERPSRAGADTRPQELVDLDQHGLGNEQLATELGDERRCEPMCTIAPIRRRDKRPGIGDDPQRAATSSRR